MKEDFNPHVGLRTDIAKYSYDNSLGGKPDMINLLGFSPVHVDD